MKIYKDNITIVKNAEEINDLYEMCKKNKYFEIGNIKILENSIDTQKQI